MLERGIWMAAACSLASSPLWAQGSRVELSASAGWTLSDGVSGADVAVPGVGTFTKIQPEDAFSWGLRLGFMAWRKAEVGVLYDRQSTEIALTQPQTVEIGDESIHNYHGYFAYNFGGEQAKARPYFLFGLGATQFDTVQARAGGVERDISERWKFSTTMALGLKAFPGPKVGIRLECRWTPTKLKSGTTGWWCDPYWGCYLTGDYSHQARPPHDQYSNQVELSGGLIFRF